MSAANVEIIRTLIPPAEADIASLLRDDRLFNELRAALEPLADPDVECVAMWQPGPARTYRGPDGLRQLWLDWLEPWQSYHVHVEELIDRGDRVVALIRDRARRHDSDAVFEIVAGSVWTLRDGKVTRVEFCTRDAALSAAEGES